jgi:glyoxylase-like metal-dependent hydrolase (beta-lactamase superfamily II)
MADQIEVVDLGMVNAYLLEAGDGFVLVDTGLPTKWDPLVSHLQASGALPDRLKLVVITHGDLDHTGGAARLQKEYNARVAIHPADADQVEKGAMLEREMTNPVFKVIMKLRRLRMRGSMPAYPTFTPDVLLSDGESLEPYGVDATILHLPGHTPGSIALLFPNGDIIAGDTVSNMIRPGTSPFVHDRQAMAASLDKLKSLDLKTIFPGHGKPFSADKLEKIKLK